jgi:hypothetical protein
VERQTEARETPILQTWQGDYPVALLNLLPRGRRFSRTGFLENALEFTRAWRAFKPLDNDPKIDFSTHLIVFTRNVTFYNRMAIGKVILKHGVAEILARETLSALPIQEKVAMAMALIPRAGVEAIAAGNERIPVGPYDPAAASDCMNTSYIIEKEEITLANGHAEEATAPHSAMKTRTSICGDVVQGDLDGDGDLDVVLFLVHNPGGSGTFFYVAAAENIHGRYVGTNAVLICDRIAPKGLKVRNGVISAEYARRAPHEPMSAVPSIHMVMELVVEQTRLKRLNTNQP